MALLLQGGDLATNGLWNFRHDPEWNAVRGNAVGASDLETGRCANGPSAASPWPLCIASAGGWHIGLEAPLAGSFWPSDR